jgi:hypothetical protein
MVGGGEMAEDLRLSNRIIDDQVCASQTNPIDPPFEPQQQCFASFIHGKSDTRRAPVDRQDAGQIQFHGSIPVINVVRPAHPSIIFLVPPIQTESWMLRRTLDFDVEQSSGALF